MWTIQEIEQYLKELAASIGLIYNTPVKINGRLKNAEIRGCSDTYANKF